MFDMSHQAQGFARPHAIVVGLDHAVGLQTARILSRRGIPVTGIVRNARHFCSQTNVCERILLANTHSDELIDILVSHSKTFAQKAVLFPCNDLSVLKISEHRASVSPFYHVALPAAHIVELLTDKVKFCKYAIKNSLPIPKTLLLHNLKEAEEAPGRVKFPCVLKPPVKSQSWQFNTKVKAFKVSDENQFRAIYRQISQWADVIIAQEWIEGDDTNLFSCNCYFNQESTPLVTFTARKLRQWPPETGETSLGEECNNEVILNETIRLFEKLGFHGLGYLEMKRDDRTGDHFMIEANIGRPTGRSALAEACGVELLYTMYCDKAGLPLPQERQQKYVGIKWLHLAADVLSAAKYWRAGKLTSREWWRSLRGPKTYAVLCWRDPKPFLIEVLWGLAFLMGPIMRRGLMLLRAFFKS